MVKAPGCSRWSGLTLNAVVCYAGAPYRFPGKHLLSYYGSATTVGHLQFIDPYCATSLFWLTEPESSSGIQLMKIFLNFSIFLLKESLSDSEAVTHLQVSQHQPVITTEKVTSYL